MGEAIVIGRILLAALVTLGLGAGTWAYEAWPSWYGQEISLQGLLGPKDKQTGRASIEFLASRVRVEGPGIVADDSPVPAYLVKQIDPVWPAGEDAVHSARLLQRRVVYVQMERQGDTPDPAGAQPAAAYGPYVPVSISRAPVAGAINLRARVTRAEPTGRFEIALAPPQIPIPTGIDENVFVTAVLRVLPSGRHAIVRVEPPR
ncbi:MAG TPA: hypothetical protein VFO31_28325 [Vicinamibacterales bacterium]|nr:hypothetical protein [Vicinamibacterales bacterium]